MCSEMQRFNFSCPQRGDGSVERDVGWKCFPQSVAKFINLWLNGLYPTHPPGRRIAPGNLPCPPHQVALCYFSLAFLLVQNKIENNSVMSFCSQLICTAERSPPFIFTAEVLPTSVSQYASPALHKSFFKHLFSLPIRGTF